MWINNSSVCNTHLKADKWINKVSAIIQSGRWLQPDDPSYTLRGNFLFLLTLQQVKALRCRENKRRKVKSTMKACSFLFSFLLKVDVQGRSLSLSLLYHFTLLSTNMFLPVLAPPTLQQLCLNFTLI